MIIETSFENHPGTTFLNYEGVPRVGDVIDDPDRKPQIVKTVHWFTSDEVEREKGLFVRNLFIACEHIRPSETKHENAST